jgi:S1-C subfamily serine protease
MSAQLAALSNEIAAAVKQAERHVVAVHARPRFSSSGVLWRPGIIVTAEHTIRREEEITVTLPDGKTVPATLAGSDSGTDLAVLKIEGPEGGPGGPPHTAAPAPGTLALAIGRSEDSGVNATLGIISACSGEWRTWRGGQLDHYIRLDLTVYPGSDGGAVINTAGEIIGVATSALSRIAGLAIPAVTVDRVLEQILSRGHVSRGYLGVGLHPVELPDHHKGLIVLSLEAAGPAAKAGVLIGDVFVALGGRQVAETEELQAALEAHAPGQSVEAEVLRGGDSRKIAITVGERPGRS